MKSQETKEVNDALDDHAPYVKGNITARCATWL